MWETGTQKTQKHPSWENITLERRNRIDSLQNAQDKGTGTTLLCH